MKITLIDSPSLRVWHDVGHRLDYLAPTLTAAGHDVVLLDAAEGSSPWPIIAGASGERDIRPLIDATRIVALVRDLKTALCIVPLRGGLAHGLLMARACGEMSAAMRIMLVLEEPSKTVLDHSGARLQPLVADAMERFCLTRADALLCADPGQAALVRDMSIEIAPIIPCLSSGPSESLIVTTCDDPTELFFVGPFRRAHGVVTFIDAVEGLLSSSATPLRRVTFCGPIDEGRRTVGKEWLGLRALRWPFDFKVVETNDFAHVVEHVVHAKGVAFFSALSPGMVATVAQRVKRMTKLARHEAENALTLREKLAAAVHVSSHPQATMGPPKLDVARLTSVPPRDKRTFVKDGETRLSICILHHERPRLLRQAIDSVCRQPGDVLTRCELIVFDNGSRDIESEEMLDRLTASNTHTVIRQTPALPHAAAMNAMASHATGSHLVFLDDDNLLRDDGLIALFEACDACTFDIVTSNLHVFDTSDAVAPSPAALMVFIGPAYTAGLFFNAFGDTCMAIRRAAFDALGGFLESGGPSPAPDWLLLARAQAAGFEIGVLQEPAFLYRRDIDKADLNAQKFDQHSLRRLLLAHYGDKFDANLVVQLAQGLIVDAT